MKLYYNDAIISAYMALEFGVQYEGDTKKDIEACQNLTDIAQFISGADVEYKPRLFIHPDSYHVFVEDDGDIIETTDFRFGEVIVREDGVAFLEGLDRNFTTKRIVLRDNKPFFMPKTLSAETLSPETKK